MGRFVQVGLVVVMLGSLAGACGQPPGSGSSQTTVTQTVTETAGPSAAPVPSAEGDIVVPDVSGMNHQDAQNKMQAAGLYNLREVDSTGKHRAMILDRNWCQTGQDPKPGAKVGKQAVITLYARKCDEH
ncbi:PASTA domain-containing protein [Amycolatopsis sp. NBC_01480]|uniref:PASTA domain-containing protein n=1 Tax=Amycolatopsis sp. NBC_01480 TaxID=2903562 RepID=UPI002E2819F5|nr:PASTA domain-containing protein [Amycolatopsis sp. NBC_01480]